MYIKSFTLILFLALLYFITGTISFELLEGQKIVSIGIFIPEGIALGFAIYFGKRVLPGIFIGQFALVLYGDIAFLPALGIALVNTTEALIGIYLFKKLQISKELKHFTDIVKLAAMIIFILQPFSASLSNFILLSYQAIESDQYLFLAFSWWFGNILGQLLVTPFLLLLFTQYKKINLLEFIFYALVYLAYLYFLEIVLQIQNPFILMGFSTSLAVFIIVRQDILHATLFILVTSLIAFYSVYLGIGAFSSSSLLNNTINYNLYILSHIVVVWLLGILFEERKLYEVSLHEKIDAALKTNKEQELLILQQNRLSQMGEFLSMIAHQWRQPLNNLHLVNQYIVNKFESNKLDEDAIEYFSKNSQKQIEYMSNTIDDFSNFFTIDKEMKNFSLNAVVKNFIKIVKPILHKNDIKLELTIEEQFTVFGHANLFVQVLLNIINNAKDALIDKNTVGKKISIDIYTSNGQLMLSIEDNAGGIDPQIIDKIFDPYFSTKKDKNGTGLGLYMSKMILQEQAQASLAVYNTTHGAKFVIMMKKFSPSS